MPKLIVFDLAGTTVNDNKDVHRVLQSIFKKIHLRISINEANQVMGIPKPEAIRKLLEHHRYPYISEMLVLEMHAHFVSKMTAFYKRHASVREKEGASDVFRICKEQGIKVVVDTGFDRAIVVPLLERMGWEKNGLIDGSITSDEVAKGRPHPDMIYRAMELTGVTDVEAVAKVGDTLSDLQEGTAAGCGWVIGVTTGAYSHEELQKGPHTHLVQHLSEMLPLVGIEQ
ncbi:MAG TPA: HAD hydrolase-like protein [Cyclobacteriaceae bacterium]|nr:HAD hydrolase-like protein [Cyclobacteriaceae bacterium]HPW61884.1 HAD hydrolase-like protein [Cyclobacteriaceae bacterium]